MGHWDLFESFNHELDDLFEMTKEGYQKDIYLPLCLWYMTWIYVLALK